MRNLCKSDNVNIHCILCVYALLQHLVKVTFSPSVYCLLFVVDVVDVVVSVGGGSVFLSNLKPEWYFAICLNTSILLLFFYEIYEDCVHIFSRQRGSAG